MLTIIPDLPDRVLGLSAEGELTGSDYETVLIPAVDSKVKTGTKIRLLYYFGNRFDGFSLSAILEDEKMGMNHLAGWEKIALVSDLHPIVVFAKLFGCMMNCKIQVFKEADLQKAKLWIVEN